MLGSFFSIIYVTAHCFFAVNTIGRDNQLAILLIQLLKKLVILD
ncbi:hypothetical protein P4482_00025 [Neobacillus thermocopriae]|nr:hypothetical protein [Neobacillus thermocopriae]MED3712624.1 hypothetical protein [Neobacillus thermocopriae]